MSRATLVTLGRPGPTWPRSVARWAAGGTLPVDVTTCLSADELRSVVEDRPVDAALVEAGLVGVDRVLAEAVRRHGAALLVVRPPGATTAVEPLEADAVLDPDLEPEALRAALHAHVRPRPATAPSGPDRADRSGPLARLVAVTGPGGAGASTVAQALATHAAAGRPGRVLLADLALDADQGLRHGLDPRTPGLFELAEAVRARRPADVEPPLVRLGAGYDVLPGLRRPQEWTVLATATVDALLAVLRRDHDLVIADVAADLDGIRECGSADLEERNALARTAVDRAEAVLVVGRGTTTGLPRLVRAVLDLLRHGVPAARLQPVVDGLPRRARRSGSAVRACARLLAAAAPDDPVPRAVGLAWDRRVEAALRESAPLPRRLVDAVGGLPLGTPP